MRSSWEDVNARARGLGTRLLEAADLAALTRLDGAGALGRALAARGVIPDEAAVGSTSDLALALRRNAAREIAVLRRWLGPRDTALAVALDAEDRRSLRSLIRGAAEGAPAEARLAGLIATPTLPERVLRELAMQVRVRDQGALLVAAGHPCGSAVLAAAGGAEPDLFLIELAIARVLADRAVRGSRGEGRLLQEYVAATIDRDNCRTALLLAAGDAEESAGPLFLPGGRVRLEEFDRAAAAGDPSRAARLLAGTAGASDIGPILIRHADAPASLDAALDEHTMATLQRESRLDPLGPAPILLFLLRLRRQSAALGRLLWAMDLGVPPAMRVPASAAEM